MIVETSAGMHVMNFMCFVTFLVFVVIFGLIVWERIPRMYLAIFGAVAMMMLGVFDIKEAIDFVNWETVGFLLGMFLLIQVLSEAGFFRWVALKLAKALNYKPLKILIFFPLLASFLSAFFDSITVMLFLSVVTFELSALLKFDPAPVVISEVVLANIGGAATLMGDPPNVILGTTLGLNFADFLMHNGPIAVLSALASVGVSFLMHRKEFSQAAAGIQLEGLQDIDPRSQIKDKYLLKLGLIGMGFALTFLIGKPFLNKLGIPIFISPASLFSAFTILTFGGRRVYAYRFMRKIDAETIMFFIGLFILIGALEKRFIVQMAANFLASIFKTPSGFIGSVFWGSGIISGFVDNVPLAMAMSYIIKESFAKAIIPSISIMVWAVSLGIDLGGNLTPIGASANVVAYSYMKKSGSSINWLRWFKLALPQSLVALLIGYLGILIKLHLKFY